MHPSPRRVTQHCAHWHTLSAHPCHYTHRAPPTHPKNTEGSHRRHVHAGCAPHRLPERTSAAPCPPPAAPGLCQGSPQLPEEPFPPAWVSSASNTHHFCKSASCVRDGRLPPRNVPPSWTRLIWNEFTGLNFWQVFLLH